jgi:hypothetical protein
VIAFASLISREALHFTQYPVATGSPPRLDLDATPRSGPDGPSLSGGYRTPTLFDARSHKTPPQGRGFVVRKGRVGKSCCRMLTMHTACQPANGGKGPAR